MDEVKSGHAGSPGGGGGGGGDRDGRGWGGGWPRAGRGGETEQNRMHKTPQQNRAPGQEKPGPGGLLSLSWVSCPRRPPEMGVSQKSLESLAFLGGGGGGSEKGVCGKVLRG